MDHQVQAAEAAVPRLDQEEAEVRQCVDCIRAWWHQAMNIVPLKYSNVAFAVGLAQEMHKLSTFDADGPPFDWDYTYANMERTITDTQYYFRLAFNEDGYHGAVCGRVMPYYFSPKLQGIEEAWYVREG